MTVLVSATDTVTYTSTLGAAIDNTEISNSTILFEDIAGNGCSSGDTFEWNGSAWICGDGIDIFDGSNTQTIDGNDTLTFAAGSGITVLVGATDTVTYSAVLGTTIDSSEIEDGTITSDDLGTDSVDSDEIATDAVTTAEIDDATILFADFAQNACGTGQVIGWDGSSWACTNATGPSGQFYSSQTTNVNTASYTAVPFDNETLKESGITHSNVTNNSRVTLDNAGTYFVSYSISYDSDGSRKTIECGIRVNGSTMITPSLSYGYARNTTDVYGTSSSSAIVTTASDNDYYEIVCQQAGSGGTSNLVANQSWTIVSSTSTGLAGSGGSGSPFDITDGSNTQTVNPTETITFAAGTGLSVLVSGPDTVTFSSDLEDSIDTSEIEDGTILNADLANSSVTITSGDGLSGGGALSLGGTLTLDIGAGNGLTVNADDVEIDVATTGLTATTSSNSGLEVSGDGLRLLGGCSDGETLVWNSSAEQWECGGLGSPTLQGVIAFGYVDGATGNLNSGDGASTSRSGTGSYTVTFDSAAADANYIVLATIEEDSTTRDDINISVDNQTTAGFDITVREGDNGATADVLIDRSWFFQVLASDGIAGGGGGSSAFNLSDGSNTQVISGGDTLTISGGTGLTVLVGATDTATISIDTGGVTTTEILDGTILLSDIAGNSCSTDQAIKYNGSSWVCGDFGTGDILDGGNTTGATVIIGTDDSNDLEFETAGTSRLFIDTSGDVGVGDTNSITNSKFYVEDNTTNSSGIDGTFYGPFTFDADGDSDESAWTFVSDNGTNGLNPANTARAWSHDTDDTTSTDVGPTSGQGGSPDGYVYTEASSPAAAADTFHMTYNTTIDASSDDWIVDFYWNQRGDDNLATVQVQTNENGAGWTTRGTYATGGPDVGTGGTQQWNNETLDLTGVISDASTQIRFLVTLGSTGNIWNNDFALDTISIYTAGYGFVYGDNVFEAYNANSTSDVDLLVLRSDVGGTGEVKFRVDSDGDVYSDGSNFIGSGADLAEQYKNTDGAEPGDVVVFKDSRTVSKSSRASQQSLAGVVSSYPGIVLDANVEGVPVALSGRAPTKVSVANGEISPGDFLTSGPNGVALKAINSGPVIGIAMEGASEDGLIDVFVNTGYYSVPLSIDLGSVFGQVEVIDYGESTEQAEQYLEDTETVVDSVEMLLDNNQYDQQQFADEILRGFSIVTERLDAIEESITSIESELASLTQLDLQDLIEFIENGELSGPVSFISDVTINGSLVISGSVILPSNTSGTATIEAGELEAEVQFSYPHVIVPSVSITPGDFIDGQWRVTDEKLGGFTIELSEPQLEAVEFTWQAITSEQ